MVSIINLKKYGLLILFGTAIMARMGVAVLGHNYDVDSYYIVAQIVNDGENVYANTYRYNYGPIWFNIIFFLFKASTLFINRELVFRFFVSLFLTIVDVGIFLILKYEYGDKVAFVFILNPISIIITGYHGQFDNFALLIGLIAIKIIGNNFEEPLNLKKLSGLLILGLSLITKHILFAFPFWLAVKQKGVLNKIIYFTVPILVFIISFSPFWSRGQVGIILNVFLYNSWNNEIFYNLFLPMIFHPVISSKLIWISILFVSAFLFRSQDVLKFFLLYSFILVTTSPAITNQYLAIPLLFLSANMNLFFVLYTIIGTWFLIIDEHGLNITALNMLSINSNSYYSILICFLILGFIVYLFNPARLEKIMKRTIKNS